MGPLPLPSLREAAKNGYPHGTWTIAQMLALVKPIPTERLIIPLS